MYRQKLRREQMNLSIKGKELIVATTVAVALHGTAALFYFDESETAGLFNELLLRSPLSIIVVMAMFPKRFSEQLRSWALGMCYSILLSAVFIFALLPVERELVVLDILIAFYLGLISTVLGASIFSTFCFLVGCFVNLFQKKPTAIG